MRTPTTALASVVVNEIFDHVASLLPMALDVNVYPSDVVQFPDERIGDTSGYWFSGAAALHPDGIESVEVGISGCV